MKTNVIHSILSCLATFVLPFMVACSRQDESLPEVGINDILAIITIDPGEPDHEETRATPTDGDYEKGSGLENTIGFDKNDFRCYLFGTDNKLVCTMEAVSIAEIDTKHELRFRLEGTEEVKGALTTGCRFVFLANWDGYPEPVPGTTTIEELCTASQSLFDFSQVKSQLSNDNLIPMYGVKEFETGVQDFKDGKTFSDIGILHLLRAYAKVDVNVTFEDFEDVTEVTSVSLTHSNGKGYKAPKNVTKQEDYVKDSWFKDYTPVNIPEDARDMGELQLTKDEQTGHYVAYVPEYKNVEADNQSRIKICFTIGETDNVVEACGYVDFKYSENLPEGVEPGQDFDIARDNWYKFDVTAKGRDITWTVDVIPFTPVDLTPDMGLERDDFTGYIIGKDDDGHRCWYNWLESPNSPEKRTPLYLGPKDHEGEFVLINDTSYLLVYTDFNRTARSLDHIFRENPPKKYLLDPEGRTGYVKGSGVAEGEQTEWYLTKLKKYVWLDEGGDPEGSEEEQKVYEALEGISLNLRDCRILYEWDRWDWDKAILEKDASVRPKYWYDVLGNRYPFSVGDYDYKRDAIIGDWKDYLED